MPASLFTKTLRASASNFACFTSARAGMRTAAIVFVWVSLLELCDSLVLTAVGLRLVDGECNGGESEVAQWHWG